MHVIIEANAVPAVMLELLAVAGTRVVVDSLSGKSVVVEVIELEAEADVAQIPLTKNRNKSIDKIRNKVTITPITEVSSYMVGIAASLMPIKEVIGLSLEIIIIPILHGINLS